jgi:phospholipase/carboxylesterase
MLPLKPEQMPNLKSVSVFVAAGRADPIVAPENTKQLVSLLEQAGADVTQHWHPGGHELTQSVIEAAQHWLTLLLHT